MPAFSNDLVAALTPMRIYSNKWEKLTYTEHSMPVGRVVRSVNLDLPVPVGGVVGRVNLNLPMPISRVV